MGSSFAKVDDSGKPIDPKSTYIDGDVLRNAQMRMKDEFLSELSELKVMIRDLKSSKEENTTKKSNPDKTDENKLLIEKLYQEIEDYKRALRELVIRNRTIEDDLKTKINVNEENSRLKEIIDDSNKKLDEFNITITSMTQELDIKNKKEKEYLKIIAEILESKKIIENELELLKLNNDKLRANLYGFFGIDFQPGKPIDFNKTLKEMALKEFEMIKNLKSDELFEDKNFKYCASLAVEDSQDNKQTAKIEKVKWLRPHQFINNPAIGFENIKPSEVIQGALGDCWFLAALSSIAKNPNLVKNILPEYFKLNGPNYKGYFKIKFWRYGEWIDVFIDDKLPTINNNLIYGKCKTGGNFWVSLIEKAYAKLNGSYKDIIGGNSIKAFMNLTGSICINLDPNVSNILSDRFLFEDELVERDQLIGCGAIKIQEKIGHDYSIFAINKILVDGRVERIYTLRNPHGSDNEGTKWSLDDPIWEKIDSESKKKVMYTFEDNLTWLPSNYIRSYFTDITLAYHIPGLSPNHAIYEFSGTWDKQITNEDNFLSTRRFLSFKHYLLWVKPTKNVYQNQCKSLVVFTLIQNNKDNQNAIGIHLFCIKKIEGLSDNKAIGSVNYREISNRFINLQSEQISSYFFLSEGYYLVIPKIIYKTETETTDYFLRVFSPHDVEVQELFLSNDLRKFFTIDYRFINILLRRCNVCENIVEGSYKTIDNYVYHNECFDSLYTCESCKQRSKSYFIMINGLQFCNECKEYNDLRIRSALDK